MPIQAAYARQPAAEARIRALAASGGFDVVHVEHLRGALLVPSPGPIPTVYDGVDCITRLFEQTLRLAPGLAQRAMARLDVGRTRRFEASLSRRFDRMIASSEAEARAFRALDPAADPGFVTALRNGVDLGAPPGPAGRRRPHRALRREVELPRQRGGGPPAGRRRDAAGVGSGIPRRGWCWPARTRRRRSRPWRRPAASRSPAT